MGSKLIDSNVFPIKTIKRLQHVRNTFIHQQPSRYVFTERELFELIDYSIKLVRFLVSDSNRLVLGPIRQKIESSLELNEKQLITRTVRFD